jgi:glycerol-3-phosphate dehydrogenase (NAD(P)+)
MSKRETVTVLGGGSWGATLAHLFACNGHDVLLWVRRKDQVRQINEEHRNEKYLPGYELHTGVRGTWDLEESMRHSKLIIVAVPSHALRQVAYEAGAFASGDQILISATKGLERESYKRMSQILHEETCCKKIGALSGPNLAREIMAGQPAATVIASRFKEVVSEGARLLASSRFKVYGNRDVAGVELSGALKNIIAIASGVAAGLGLGDNSQAMLITRGLAEIRRMGEAAGADPLTFGGLAGVGDLMATCASSLSRNHQVGFRLAQGETLEHILDTMVMVAEGVNTALVAKDYARRVGVEMPITLGVCQLLYDGVSCQDVIHELMTRRSTYEIDATPIHD